MAREPRRPRGGGDGRCPPAGGLAAGLGYAASLGDASVVTGALAGAAVQTPAAFVMIGVVVAAFGLAPRFTTATWAVLVAFLLIGEFGPLFELPGWVMALSPFAHVPRIPGQETDAGPLIGLMLVAIALATAGAIGFHRRDVLS